jgi:hypothetical protein
MTARLVDGILCDYSVAQCERMAMDRALPRDAVLAIDTGEALREYEREQLAKLVPHFNRL